jgi:hypothetical protein
MGLSPRRTPRIDVRIDALVLDGVSADDPRVAQAVEQATRRALAAQPRAAVHAQPAAIGDAVSTAVARQPALRRVGGGS